MATSSQLVAALLVFSAALAILAPSCMADGDVLFTGQPMNSGQFLANGLYMLTLESDCNLVLYDNSAAIWSTGTSGQGTNCQLLLQNDGNLVIYDGDNKPVWWASDTAGVQGYYVLVVRPDGNVVIYGPAIWATNAAK